LVSAIENRIDTFNQQTRMKAGSLIISVFGDSILPRGGKIWLGSLIKLLEPLNLSDRLIRTSIFRLVKDEWLQSQASGRRADYFLTGSGLRRFEESAQQIYAAHSPAWDRRWRFVLVVGSLDNKAKEKLRRAFFWQGFGMVGADCFVHPSANLNATFDALVTDGLAQHLKNLMPSLATNIGSDLSADDVDLVKSAWNLQLLGAGYSEFLNTYQPVLEQLRQQPLDHLSDKNAFLIRTLLIHDYRRLLLRDPELPEVLLPVPWPGEIARKLCKNIYRHLVAQSERHIDLHFQLADGSSPSFDTTLSARFMDNTFFVRENPINSIEIDT
jgi:phenylacetic acid degradation operon negative regulatory protein